MTTSLLTKSVRTQNNRLISQLETIQEELPRLSGYVSELLDLPREQLKTLEIEDQVDKIHCCLKRFEAYCMANRALSNEDEFTKLENDMTGITFPQSSGDWNPVRREAKHANKLARQLIESISKISTELSENQYPGGIPEDILHINQTLQYIVNDFR